MGLVMFNLRKKERNKIMKKIVSLLLAVSMLGAFAGCGNKAGEEGVTTIKVYTRGERTIDHDKVIKKINEQLVEKYGMKLDLLPISSGDYVSKMQVICAAQENFDLMFIGGTINLYNNVKTGTLADITDLLPQYAPELYNSMSETVWSAGMVDGRIYTAPIWQIMARADCFVTPRAFLEETGTDIDDINSMEDIEAYLTKIHAIHPETNQLLETVFRPRYYKYLEITDADKPGMIRESDCTSGKKPIVVNQYESKEFKEYVTQRYDWAQRGLITDTYSPDTQGALKRGLQPFWFTATYKPGVQAELCANVGVDVVAKQFTPGILTPGGVIAASMGVSATSNHPEKAVKFLEILNTDKEIYNEIVWGFEGENYEKLSDEKIRPLDTEKYGYYNWAIGSVKNSYLLESQDDNVWEETAQANDIALVSPLMGLSIDTTPIISELTDCQTVLNEKLPLLVSGLVEPEQGIKELIDALKIAGSDRIIEELQHQIDKFWETK